MKSVKDAVRDNWRVLKEVQELVYSKEDIYSFVASRIFNVPIDECREYILGLDYARSEEGKRRRDIAKWMCLNRASIEDIATKFGENPDELKCAVVKAFPFTSFDDINECYHTGRDVYENDTDQDELMNACSFITQIRGYVQIYRQNIELRGYYPIFGARAIEVPE